MAIPIVNSRDLANTWRILDDKLGNFRERGLPFKIPYVGAFSQSVAEWFIKVYSDKGDTVFDPFCVCKDSIVLLNQQDQIPIQNIEKRRDVQIDLFGESGYIDDVMSVNIERDKIKKIIDENNTDNEEKENIEDLIITSNIKNFFTKESKGVDIYNVYTRNRRSLNASGNHVFLVKSGNKSEWKQLKDIKFGDLVAIYPSIICLDNKIEKEEIILNEKDILDNIPDNTDKEKILIELKNAKLLPLTNNHPKLHIIARLCGFLLTDGFMSENHGERYYDDRNRKGNISHFDISYTHVHFTSGRDNSLLSIYQDIKLLDLNIGKYLKGTRLKESSKENWRSLECPDLDIYSKTVYVLFKSLGIPWEGKKTNQVFRIPPWIYKCSMRVKQEFLGGLAGGDGTTVGYSNKKHPSGRIIPNIIGVGITQSKITELEQSLQLYLSDIGSLFDEFGLKYKIMPTCKYIRDEDGKEVVTYRIDLLDNHENTLRFLKYIGYRYDDQKIGMSYPIYEYLLSKQNRIWTNKGISRGNSFPLYEKWKDIYTLDGMVFDDVITIKKIEYNDKLYDISVEMTQNYIVNGFITHNSGRGTTAMQSLYNGRNMITNDLSPYSNILCHSIMFVPYMKDVIIFINSLEEYINSDGCKVSKDYAGKGSEDDAAKLYHESTFDQIIKLRNTLNNRDVLLGFGDDLFKDIHYDGTNLKEIYTYRHEVAMFTRMVMSQLMLHSSQDMSFNGIKTRGTDNTYIKGILKYYATLGESPKRVNIFENMKYYVEKMELDSLGIRDKFIKLNRNMISCDARKLDLPDKCVDIVVTSPPYYANLNYGMANWLRIWSISGIGDPLIGNRINSEIMEVQSNSEIYGKTYDRITDKAGGTVDNPMAYSNFTGWYLKELNRVLKDDAVAIIVVGDYGNKRKVEAWRLVTDRAEIFGFKPVTVIMDELNKQTKSSTQFQAKHEGGKNDFDVCVILAKGNYTRKNEPENIDFRWSAKFCDGRQLDIESAWG